MILVTGGTGLIGSHLLYQLAVKKEKVRAIYRDHGKLETVQKIFSFYTDDYKTLFASVEWVKADLNNIPSLEKAFQDIEYVYHCAALISFQKEDYINLRKVNIEGTANIVNLSIEHKIKKLCHVSSIAAFGKGETNTPINEETHWNPEAKNSNYAISKYGAEMEIWRGSQEGIKTIVVSPGVVLGAGFSSGSSEIFNKVTKGLSYYTPGGSGFVDVEDVVNIMTALMESEIHNENYILVSENWSFKKLLNTIAKELEKPELKKEASLLMLNIACFFDAIKAFLTGRKRLLSRSTVEFLSRQSSFSNEKIKNDLNYNFKPLEESIRLICKRITN
ncbi:NAD-dependent epimerase/dehydratase family protein [Flavobacteriaceae bacterium R38]|nr:NAD-dependent epimerase/dehydratase family protein [Flavobacteriaceae bacterium R38]